VKPSHEKAQSQAAKTASRIVAGLVCLLLSVNPVVAIDTLLPEPAIAALAQEISGETAKRNLEYLARHHRMRGSRGFRAAAAHIVEQLRAYGLSDARIEEFPADGKRFYGTQKSRLPWDAEFAELWELRERSGQWVPHVRLASWEATPVSLAQDSESGEATADLIDIGAGTSERDYAGKDLRGKLVLTSSQPAAVVPLAIKKYDAAGIISYAQNQRTAWYGEDENLVRWGHLDTFSPNPTFAFMISLKQARSFQSRLARGERIRLHASVKAGKYAGTYDVVTATIPGSDPNLRNEEIVFSCHLDHQRPGANDNASGSVAILEVARTFSKLIRERKIAPPARTIRFIWPPEIEGTITYLNARPEIAARMKAVIHMDMVGGGPETKAIFHVTRGPNSLPSFVNDVAEHFGEFVNEQSANFARGQAAAYPLLAPEGGKEPLLAEIAPFSLGSDHQVYADSSFGIPAIYLNDWPDRYIHTNFDTPANVDPTKLKRAAFIGAASALFLANANPSNAPDILRILQVHSLRRTATMLAWRNTLPSAEGVNLTDHHLRYESAVVDSMERFFRVPQETRDSANTFLMNLGRQIEPKNALRSAGPAGVVYPNYGLLVFRRRAELKGPLSAFGYDYFDDHYRSGAPPALMTYRGLRGSGGDYAYEVLNLVDGRRTVVEIRDAVSATYGPVLLNVVYEYLKALESIRVIEQVK
jgi:aminopeptidase YwaD